MFHPPVGIRGWSIKLERQHVRLTRFDADASANDSPLGMMRMWSCSLLTRHCDKKQEEWVRTVRWKKRIRLCLCGGVLLWCRNWQSEPSWTGQRVCRGWPAYSGSASLLSPWWWILFRTCRWWEWPSPDLGDDTMRWSVKSREKQNVSSGDINFVLILSSKQQQPHKS